MKNKFKSCRVLLKNEAGFTLIELLIVIVVLGILMSMAVPALSGVKNKADTAVAKADLHNIMQSLEMYYFDHGEYPTESSDNKFTTIAEKLENLNIKNKASVYEYQSNTDQDKYMISYKTASGKYYYISSDGSALDSVSDNATL